MQNATYPFITPSSTCLSEDLLFFDTFSHYDSEEDNFDLVQFPSPVVIDLIKIIPLGQPIEAKIPGNVRLGATNPSNCELEFFINDLTKQDAHTMTDLGKFHCSEKDTDFNPPIQVQTDGLLLRGSYKTLTLAIFGQIATYDEKVVVEDDTPMLASATSPPAQTPASPIASERDIPYIVNPVDQDLIRRVREGSESLEESPIHNHQQQQQHHSHHHQHQHHNQRKSSESNKDLQEPLFSKDNQLTPENDSELIDDPTTNDMVESDSSHIKNRTIGIEEMSSSELLMPANNFNSTDKKSEEIDYSNPSTDLDNNNYSKLSRSRHKEENSTNHGTSSGSNNLNSSSHNNTNADDQPSYDDDDNISLEAREWTFNVETYKPKPLLYFPDPSLTLQERSIEAFRQKKLAQTTESGGKSGRDEITKVREMFESLNCTDDHKSDDWVTLLEDLHNDIANMSLSETISNPEFLKFLVKQVSHGLDMDLAIRQKQIGFKVRHLRAGVKLATILFHSGDAAIHALLEESIPRKVLELYNKDQMSLPLRLLIFKCLNAACDSVEGANHIIQCQHDWNDKKFTISNIKKNLVERDRQTKQQRNMTECDESQKSQSITIDGDDSALKSQKQESIEDVPTSGDGFSSIRRNSTDSDLTTFQQQQESRLLTCYQYMLLILMSQPTTRVTIAIGNLIKKIHLYQSFLKLSQIQLSIDESEDVDNVFHSEEKTVNRYKLLEQSLLILQDIVNLTKNNSSNIAQPIRYLPAKAQFQVKPNTSDTFLAVYRWLKQFKTLEYFNTLLVTLQNLSSELTTQHRIEQSIRIQNLCLLFLQQLMDSPRGAPLLLSSSYYEITANLIKSLASNHAPKRSSHLRISDGIENCLNAALHREELLSVSSCNDMSLRLCYNLKIFSCIDKLFNFHRELIGKREESSLCDPEKVLHQLYIMSDHPYGLAAIIKHFTSIGNLDCLLRFLDMPEHHKQLEFVKETSIDYALELIGTFFRLNNNVLEIADEYLDTLIELCKNKEKNLSIRIRSLLPWLTPFNTDKPLPLITYSEDTFRQLTRIIRKSIPNYSIPFANGLNFELPPHMITAVRILRQLCIPPQVESFIESTFDIYSTQKLLASNNSRTSFTAFVHDGGLQANDNNYNHCWNLNLQFSRNNGQATGSFSPEEDSLVEQLTQISNTFKLFQPYEESICGDLKYHYGIMQTFEQEGLRRLLNTLRELTGNYPRPIYQSAALSGFRGRIVLSYVHSVVILLHSMICHLIDARGSEFKDTNVISVVLETYSLLCFVPKPKESKTNAIASGDATKHDILALQKSIILQSDNYQLAQQTKKLIISLLMAYTQMCLTVSESEEKVISKSMWTKMLKEVIEFTLSTPVFFHHGLDVLTKILPQSLPSSSMMDSIDQEQLFKNINHRKLWSAHLHPLHQQIEQLISNLSICYQPSIRTLLYNLCNQLCDLSSNAACMVAKIITDNLVTYVTKSNTETNSPTTSSSSNPAVATTTAVDNTSANTTQPNDSSINQQLSASSSATSNHIGDDRSKNHSNTGKSTSIYAIKMILNLLTNLITNQAFETALSNQLQILGKKDEKLLISLQNGVKLYSEHKPSVCNNTSSDDCISGGANSCLNLVNQFIDTIKAINDNNNISKDGLVVATNDIGPPEELTKINLLEVARKTSDRFSLSSNLKQTYRLKVLMDLQSHAHRTSESSTSSSKRFDHNTPYNYQEISVPSSHKAYVAPIRGRGRPQARPDSFRSRPQNTSRPPSIHVDDFVDLYGADKPGGSSSSSGRGYKPVSSKTPLSDYRSSSRPYPDMSPPIHGGIPEIGRHPGNVFFGQQLQPPPPPPPPHSGSPYSTGSGGGGSGSGAGRSMKGAGKYMKLK